MTTAPSTVRKRIAGVALIGAIAGAGVIAASVAANATDATPAPATSTSTSSGTADSDAGTADSGAGTPAPSGTVDESKSVRSDEHLLTGTDADSATAAALAAYPGATIQRVETDSDGVYEAHLVTAAGERLIVQMDASFTVTGTQTGGPGGGAAGSDKHGASDGARGTAPTDAQSATTTS
ncbi:hypothetical protein [Cellulomonas sp. WB94]|uniref:hypothetical protein n=1 Tax=Cellulomonas sp. WB94 TaxID=2173174 RepID=UPI0018D50DAD|nr:hypothetical protein [Cellulomonas sp. WB94]